MIDIKIFTFNHFEVNTFVVYDDTKHCAVIDPGMEYDSECRALEEFISSNALIPEAVLLTHTHIDHVAGLRFVTEKYSIPAYLHPDAMEILRQSEIYGSVMGFNAGNLSDVRTSFINDGDIITFGNSQLEARYVPGHAAGSMAYCLHSQKSVFTGDALFCQSIGRTDLPTGDYDLLIEKLKQRILPLPDDYRIYPGHGPSSSIGFEKQHNPFVQHLFN